MPRVSFSKNNSNYIHIFGTQTQKQTTTTTKKKNTKNHVLLWWWWIFLAFGRMFDHSFLAGVILFFEVEISWPTPIHSLGQNQSSGSAS